MVSYGNEPPNGYYYLHYPLRWCRTNFPIGSKAHLGRLFRSLGTTFFMLTSGLTPWGTHL